jgi:tape measure domain-containing protein
MPASDELLLKLIYQEENKQALTNAERALTQLRDEQGRFIKGAAANNAEMGRSQNAMKGLGQAALGLKTIVGGALVAGLGAAAVASIKLGIDMEQTTMAFTSMMGSAEQANKFLAELRAFADATPFEFNELTGAAKRMMAFGFTVEQIIPMLTAVGDASSALGLGGEGIDRVTRAIGQMQAKGKVSGEEMMQLAEAGIPAWKYLAEGIGKTTGETMKLSEKGLIPAGDAIKYLLAGMEKDFGGMMAKQAQTAGGLLSTLADKLKGFATDIGTSLIPALKEAIENMSGFLDTLREGLRIGDLLINWQGRLRDGVQGVNTELLNSAGSYKEYTAGVIEAAVASGQMGRAEADALENGTARETLIRQANQLFGLMTEAQYNAARGAWGYAGALDESNRALKRANELKVEAAKIAEATPAITNIGSLTPEAQAAAVKEYGKTQEKLTAIEAGGITKRADLLSKFYADEATAIKELQSSRINILSSYAADEQKITADQNKSRIALARQYGEAAERAEEDHQRNMTRMSEDHGRRLSKLADSRDALGIEDEMDNYAIERRRAEEDYQVGAGRSEDYAQQLADLNTAAEEQRLARTVEKDKQLRELEAKYAEENIKRSTAKTKELAIIDQSIADEKAKTETAWKLWRNEHEIFFKGDREAWDSYLKYTKESLLAASGGKVLGETKLGGGRASGGAVLPFGTYTVGENGPEILRMGAQGGYVESNKGGNNFNVSVNVGGSNATPEQIKSAVYQGIVDVMRAVH